MRNINAIALSLAALLIAAGAACAEKSGLTEDEALSLTEHNYRQQINANEECIVLFYKSSIRGTATSDNVIKALKNSLPKHISFFKVDLSKFSRQESEYIAKNDIGRKVVPSIIPYKHGFPISGKVLGAAKKRWITEIVSVYSKEYR
jgi:hypothetical protein